MTIPEMTKSRWQQVMNNDDEVLTEEELASGWHFCNEFDGLLVGPDMKENQFCSKGAGCPDQE